jgi:hypothetical protein
MPNGIDFRKHEHHTTETMACTIRRRVNRIARQLIDQLGAVRHVRCERVFRRVFRISRPASFWLVWAVAKGSMLNKAILVPAALLLSAFVPWVVIPLMMMGGAFLSREQPDPSPR